MTTSTGLALPAAGAFTPQETNLKSVNGNVRIDCPVNGTVLGECSNAASKPESLSATIPPNVSLQVTAERTIKLVEDSALPRPGSNEVLIHVKATGICGSDIHFWKSGAIGSLKVDGDCILGHEGAGIVLEVGSQVLGLYPGDKVAIEPGVPCGSCFLCGEGRYNLCEDVAFAGVYPYSGTAQRYKVHPAKWVHKLPAGMKYEHGALLEPLSVVMHGISSCGTSLLGKAVAIQGAGPIGLISLAAARASGAHPIVITDIEPRRLAFARMFVPGCQTYLIEPHLNPRENAERIRILFGVEPVDASRHRYKNEYDAPATVLECTGVESSIVTAAYTCRRGGTVMFIGVGREIINNFPFMHLSLTEINLKFINRYRDTWPSGISALSGGVLDLDPLITHRYPLEQAVEAMHLVSDPAKGGMKVQIVDDLDITMSNFSAALSR